VQRAGNLGGDEAHGGNQYNTWLTPSYYAEILSSVLSLEGEVRFCVTKTNVMRVARVERLIRHC
jgi:hypothetical protein